VTIEGFPHWRLSYIPGIIKLWESPGKAGGLRESTNRKMLKNSTKFLIPQFALAHFSHHVSTGVLIPLLPLIREFFNLNYFQAGLLVSFFSIAYGIAQIPMAIIADKFGRRLIVILGLISLSLTGIGVSLTREFWQMAPFFVVMGLVGGSYHAPATSFISQLFASNQRGKALGFHTVGGSASFLLTPAMALGIAYLFQTWRASFFILSLPALLVGTMLYFTTHEKQSDLTEADRKPENPETTALELNKPDEHDPKKVTWIQIIRAIGIIAVLSMTIQMLAVGVRSYLPLYMVDHHSISPKLAGVVISVISSAGIIGAPLGGMLSDRFGRKNVILFGVALSGPMFFAVTRSPYGVPLLLALFLYGMTMSVRMPSMESLITDVVPVGRRTTVLGIYFFMGMEFSGITTPIIGRLIDVYGLDPVFTSVAVGLCVIAAFALLFRKKI